MLETQSESLGEDGEESKEEKLDKIYKKVINILQNSISDLSNDVKDVIHDQGNKLYKQMLKDPTKNTLQINSDYGLDLVDKNGEIITDSSGGEQIMVMSLFHGLKKATGIEGPLVIDTPLARIDEENSPEILKVLPSIATQCILIPTNKEIPDGGEEEKVLMPLVGRRYEITKISDQESQIIEK